jgi:cold shock CspA family protein
MSEQINTQREISSQAIQSKNTTEGDPMTQTGVVHRLWTQGTFCFIQLTTGKEVYAHKSAWVEPWHMSPGRFVKFTLAEKEPGLKQKATRVEEISDHPTAA